MLIQFIRFTSALDLDEILERAKKRTPEFEKLPGLVQKYYVRSADGKSVGGLYVWESEEKMRQFRETELAATIPSTYEILGTPDIDMYEVLYTLR